MACDPYSSAYPAGAHVRAEQWLQIHAVIGDQLAWCARGLAEMKGQTRICAPSRHFGDQHDDLPYGEIGEGSEGTLRIIDENGRISEDGCPSAAIACHLAHATGPLTKTVCIAAAGDSHLDRVFDIAPEARQLSAC